MISFIMPLYGAGVKRPSIFDAALVRERLPSSNRNAGVDTSMSIERGSVPNVAGTVFAAVFAAPAYGTTRRWLTCSVLVAILPWAWSLGVTA
jgi:hypothetical protein